MRFFRNSRHDFSSDRRSRRQILLFIMCLCIWGVLLGVSAHAERVIPDCLRFSQAVEYEHIRPDLEKYVTLPSTALPQVDREIADVAANMLSAAKSHIPGEQWHFDLTSVVDVGPTITRVGDRWMSFVTILRITEGYDQVYVDMDARTFNMETGERVRLEDIIDAGSGGWDYLSRTVREQLTEFFPHLEPDEEVLSALCSPEALRDTAFSLSPGHLTLIWRARDLYPLAPAGLMRVEIYYPDLKPYMTQTALRETDCTGYALLALTYDDGPIQYTSDRLMDQLRCHGAEATFFLVVSNVQKWLGVVHREYDAGHSVQSHNWLHVYTDITRENVTKWTTFTFSSFREVLGRPPVMMRAPGGQDGMFIKAGCPLPMIHWSKSTTDANSDDLRNSVKSVVMAVRDTTVDGDIVLMHDLNMMAPEFAEEYLPGLEERNFLLVTVQDLCSLRGVTLETGKVVINCYPGQ